MSADADRDLLRRFEPVLCFTKGERFYPMDVDPYVRLCSLWTRRPREEPVCLLPQGEVTLDTLARSQLDEARAVQFLKFTEPLHPAELAFYKLSKRSSGQKFHAGVGRLARVGYLSRFFDAAFAISLLARGRVRGDAAAAATIAYDHLMGEQESYCYQGRVTRQDGWIVLQYWFFYLFDDWRSGFFGANDHEADWEMVCVYLSESATGELSPAWAAYAAHNESGDNLRRRWDDPELKKIGDHPVVYIGAGSHASYFRSGEYLTEIDLPLLRPYARVADRWQEFWHQQLRQYGGDENQSVENERANIFRVPFVDYARGDGLTIGPGQAKEWRFPRLLSPPPAWVTAFRGLWGLYAQDPFEGEDAPPGPMYNRDGTVRRAWFDPVGWSGLDKVPPPNEALATAMRQQEEVEERRATLNATVEEKGSQLQRLGIERDSLSRQAHLEKQYEAHSRQVAQLSQDLEKLRDQLASDQVLLESLQSYSEQLQAGELGPTRAHISRAHEPTPEEELRLGRLAEIWAASSVGLMMLGLIYLVIFDPGHLVVGLVGIIALFVLIEASFRRQLTQLVTGVTIILAVISAAVLLWEFFWQTAVIAVLVAGVYILWDNLRELWT